MTIAVDDLFRRLDLDGDGLLSRDELCAASTALGWHWPEAPLYSFLDLMTVLEPLPRKRFLSLMDRILGDPHGPFCPVLRLSPLHTALEAAAERPRDQGLDPRTALLIIDPQHSFTGGAWMRSIGHGGVDEVAPIRSAFAGCAELLESLGGRVETMFTRCPFPPDSYTWDEQLARLIGPRQLYFLKPGNSVLWPPANGIETWIDILLGHGVETLVIGGCTLNSCVRVSAVQVARRFGPRGLKVAVDLSLSGARSGNYRPSPLFGGLSPVEAAVSEMRAAGVNVVERFYWA